MDTQLFGFTLNKTSHWWYG